MGLWGKESTYTKLLQRISEKNEEGLELRRQSLQNDMCIRDSNKELECTGIKFCSNSEYAPEYLKEAAVQYAEVWQIDETMFVHGRGHRKTTQQRHYEKMCIRDRI